MVGSIRHEVGDVPKPSPFIVSVELDDDLDVIDATFEALGPRVEGYPACEQS